MEVRLCENTYVLCIQTNVDGKGSKLDWIGTCTGTSTPTYTFSGRYTIPKHTLGHTRVQSYSSLPPGKY